MSKATDDRLVEALFNHDDTILARIYGEYAQKMKDHFLIEFPIFKLDAFPLEDVITDALLNLCKNPQKFNPQKSSLKTYLFRDVRGDIINLLNKRKTARNMVENKVVELDSDFGNIELQDNIEELGFDYNKLSDKFVEYFANIFPEEIDQKLAWMIKVEKIRETIKYSQLLGIDELSSSMEKEKIVKKHKDRIILRLKRAGYDNFIKELKQ
jgi:hypothetical protein